MPNIQKEIICNLYQYNYFFNTFFKIGFKTLLLYNAYDYPIQLLFAGRKFNKTQTNIINIDTIYKINSILQIYQANLNFQYLLLI